MPRVIVLGFEPFEGNVDATLLEACDLHGIPMESACGGFAACNSCRVSVVEGAENLTPLCAEEDPFLDTPGQRLGCQARLRGGTVRVRLDAGT